MDMDNNQFIQMLSRVIIAAYRDIERRTKAVCIARKDPPIWGGCIKGKGSILKK